MPDHKAWSLASCVFIQPKLFRPPHPSWHTAAPSSPDIHSTCEYCAQIHTTTYLPWPEKYGRTNLHRPSAVRTVPNIRISPPHTKGLRPAQLLGAPSCWLLVAKVLPNKLTQFTHVAVSLHALLCAFVLDAPKR